MADRPPPSEQELEVLKVLWEEGSGTVRGWATRWGRGRRWGYTTVQTYLNRLRSKGHVASRPGEGTPPAHVYRPVSTRDDLLRDRLRELADQLCGGESTPLVLTLVEGHRFSAEEVERFRAILDGHRPGGPKP